MIAYISDLILNIIPFVIFVVGLINICAWLESKCSKRPF